MKCRVVNVKHEAYDTFCGRGSIFGNPYIIGKDGDRPTVIERYKQWFSFLLNDKLFVEQLRKLKGQTLGCYCKQPNEEVACHVDYIAQYVDKMEGEDFF